jgi:hypothetical protein
MIYIFTWFLLVFGGVITLVAKGNKTYRVLCAFDLLFLKSYELLKQLLINPVMQRLCQTKDFNRGYFARIY